MLVVIKGAGDLATGIAVRLKKAGFDVVMTEIERPTVVRHTVAFAGVIYTQCCEVENVTGRLCTEMKEVETALADKEIVVIVDPKAECIKTLKPQIVVDAIIAKRNLGTSIQDAQVVVGVGPGFAAGEDCHYVVETKRGHYLGQVLETGCAIPNTGVPGEIGGYTTERIIRSPKQGIFKPIAQIGDEVKKGECVGWIDGQPIEAAISGIVRGILLREMQVPKGFKCGDIDPRCVREHCFSVSDKARAIGGGVLEAIMRSGIVGLK